MNPKRYCQIFLLLTGGLLLVVALVNFQVDPIGAYPGWHLQAFAPQRDSMFSRMARGEQARRGDCDMAIFGTSRPKAGMPSSHPAFATHRARNFAVDAACMTEAAAMFDYCLAHNPIRRVVLCLDFALFRPMAFNQLGMEETRFHPDLSLFDYHCKNILGADPTSRSFRFVTDVLSHKSPPAAQRRGFYVHQLKPGSTHRLRFEKIIRALAYGNATLQVAPEQMQALRHVLAKCRDRHVELTLAINPVHALDLELFQVGHSWERFEQWKRDLVKMVAEESPDDRVVVWDFTAYDGLPAEKIPPAGDSTRMKFYFESSHYTPVTGGLMLDRMFQNATNDFGRKISVANLEEHLKNTRAQREAFVARYPADVEWAHGVARKVLAGRRHDADPAEGE